MKSIFLFLLFYNLLAAQTSSINVFKVYNVSSGYESNGNKVKYEVDGKQVSKKKYYKYKSPYDEAPTDSHCHPCIIKHFDINEHLLYEELTLPFKRIGFYNEYYLNGKIKIAGHFKNGYKDSTWVHYDDKGIESYREYWLNDSFLYQSPEQEEPDLWKVEFFIDTILTRNYFFKSIDFNDLKKLNFKYYFKNKNHDISNLNIYLKFSFFSEKTPKITFDKLKEIELSNILNIEKLKLEQKKIYTYVSVYYSKSNEFGTQYQINNPYSIR